MYIIFWQIYYLKKVFWPIYYLKKVVPPLQHINISMELFLKELYFLVDVYNILTNLLPKESSPSFAVY